MVSLPSHAASSGTYPGFSGNHTAINATDSDDDLIVDHIELVSGPEMSHKPVGTTWAIIFAKIVYVILGVSAYIIPHICDTQYRCGEDALSLVLYIHGGMWFTLLVLDQYFQLKHEQSRRSGYLEFYRKTRNIRRMPVLINSCANAVMVIVTKLLDSHCCCDGCLTKARYIQIFITIECAVALIFLMVYLVHTLRFNSKKALPDVSQEDATASFATSHSHADLGFRNGNYDDQVMEKQADLIRYLRQHTEALAKRNLTLTQEVNRLKR